MLFITSQLVVKLWYESVQTCKRRCFACADPSPALSRRNEAKYVDMLSECLVQLHVLLYPGWTFAAV